MLRSLAVAGALALAFAAGGAADCGGSSAEVHFTTINVSPATPVKGQPVSLVSDLALWLESIRGRSFSAGTACVRFLSVRLADCPAIIDSILSTLLFGRGLKNSTLFSTPHRLTLADCIRVVHRCHYRWNCSCHCLAQRRAHLQRHREHLRADAAASASWPGHRHRQLTDVPHHGRRLCSPVRQPHAAHYCAIWKL